MSISLTHSTSSKLPIGTFVSVGDDIGTIVGWPDSANVPDEHYAVWFGEKSTHNVARCRTVPFEYCVVLNSIEFYH